MKGGDRSVHLSHPNDHIGQGIEDGNEHSTIRHCIVLSIHSLVSHILQQLFSILTWIMYNSFKQEYTRVFVTAPRPPFARPSQNTHGSVYLGSSVPNSLIRSLMLNLRLLSTANKANIIMSMWLISMITLYTRWLFQQLYTTRRILLSISELMLITFMTYLTSNMSNWYKRIKFRCSTQ